MRPIFLKIGVLAEKQYAQNTSIVLYPFSPFVEEWYNLAKSFKMENAMLSQEVMSVGLATTTDEYGNFTFKNLKPGKYFLMTSVNIVKTRTASEKVGAWVDQNGYEVSSINNYYNVSFDTNEIAKKVVEIKNDGEMVDVKLKPGNPIIEAISTGTLKSSKCYFDKGLLYGTCKMFYPNGKPELIADWKKGAFDGKTTTFRKDGTTKIVAEYKNHQMNGDYISYNENGTISSKTHLKNGKLDQPLIIFTYDKSGKLWYDNSFRLKDNIPFVEITKDLKLIKEGSFHLYYPSGKVKQTDVYKDDFLVSMTGFKENGTSFKIGETINGKFKGEYTYYDDRGKPTQTDTYNEGVKVSSKKF